MMKGDLCRTARKLLMIGNINKLTDENKKLLDHLLGCIECQTWVKKSGMLSKLDQAFDERMNGLHCPVCLYPMTVNRAFKVAKCFTCDLTINWSSSYALAVSIFRIVEIQLKRKGITVDRLPIPA